uniref:laminin subunit gamma-3 n=1 Tax=Panthera onca TaxID=9690 RepID=UPI002953C57B|nr:laminin subunit gamma-3 [Panthera onca]
MAAAAVLLGLALLAPRAAGAGMGACYDGAGRPQRCLPVFENAAFGRRAEASHTCGRPPEDFCPHVGAPGAGAQCQRCDADDPQLHHDASYLTDFHSQDDSTWWQSPSMAFGVQYPTSVNITLRLGKAYEITYVRLKFHTSRPESFAIYKRTHAGSPWEPYQYYSASCQRTYGRPEGHSLRPGEDERVAFCTSEFSDISPLSGGNVAFSTLEGRPSAYNFDESPVLQEWVTSTELLISLDRLNTFGDDIFKDPKVLQSYYYAVSDFSVGGRCQCHGHASECGPEEAGRLACRCQHNTTGVDCERCLPFFQDRPWARGTAEAANECVPCNCNGHSEECVFDRDLFRGTGHGGRCLRCRDHTAGPHCERCQEDFYRWSPRTPCQPCDCHPAGSLRLQCDDSGTCACKATVTGWKCDRCLPGFHSLSEGGCRPCTCDPAGSLGTCDPHSGRCPCKENVEGKQCDRCRPGTFNLQPHNPAGCSSCFCFGHSKVCSAAAQFREHHILSDLRQGAEGWRAGSVGGPEHPAQWSPRGLLLNPEGEEELTLPEKFLGDQRFSYGQPITLTFWIPPGGSPLPVRLRLEGAGLALTLRPSSLAGPRDAGQPGEAQLTFQLQETSEDAAPPLPPFHFQQLLANLTALRIRAGGQSTSPSETSEGQRSRTLAEGRGTGKDWEGGWCLQVERELASKLKARLTLMEGWLQGSDCSEPWGPLHVLQGEAPRGDVYQGRLLQGAREAFQEQVTGLEGAVKAAREQLRALSRSVHCARAGTEKTCIQLADLDAALESSEEEILQAALVLRSLVIPQEGSSQPTTWSHLATEARALARSHRDTTAKIEATARRALVASNTSYALLWSLVEGTVALEAQQELEDRYQEVQAAQKALGTAAAEALPEAGRALAAAQQADADAALRPASLAAPAGLKSEAGALGLKAQALEKTVASRERVVTEAARVLQATAQAVLRKTEPLTQLRQQARAALTRASSSVQAATVTVTGARTLLADLEGMKPQFPSPKDRATLGRKAGVVRGRLLADLKKKTKQAERMLGNAASVSSSAKKKGREAKMLAEDSAKLARALLRDGKQEHRRAGRLSSQAQATLRQASRQVLASQTRRQELEEAEQVGAGLRAVERQIWESRTSLEEDVQALLELLARLGSLDTHHAPAQALNETQWALERLRLRLSPPGALQGKLRLLEQESKQQELQIQSFENDLAEIRADKQNLEAILQSLPKSCASWR